MKFLYWTYSFVIFICFCSIEVKAAALSQVSQNNNKNTISSILKAEKRKKGGWRERMRQRIYKLLKAHDAFLIAFLICLFLLALAFMLGVYWVKNPEVVNALNYVSLGLVVITAIFGILWLMTVNMRKQP
ncbi:MAG: hypothetical protein NZ455_01705 [Bacteroidia bacterium]|nr:hypothetical protein [Bacteroidia bacterium]MDW8347115.1 hypothetical protein [Bacteroidia bacterium]